MASRSQLALSVVIASLSACSGRPGMVESGFWGGATGAGTGALVGALIANGDVAASAGLGAAIGVPAGIALGALYMANLDAGKVDDRLEDIRANQRVIFQNERELDRLRAEAKRSDLQEPDPGAARRPYLGPTRGYSYR